MARLVLFSLPILVMLPHSSFGATWYSDGQTRVMRRATPSDEIELGPHGDMIQLGVTSAADPNTLVKTRSKAADEYNMTDLAMEFCDYDYPLGREGTNNCTDAAKHSLILQESMCVEAANEAGATTPPNTFRLPYDWEDKHPKGCFKYSCPEAANNVCYFYNGDGDTPGPGPLGGTPICSRPRHLNGTKDSAAVGGGCPAGYQLVDHEETCRAAATCLGYCTGAEFRIGMHNASEHRDYPRGCFVHNIEGCVYYNPESPVGAGTHVQGTPLCNVSSITRWPAVGGGGGSTSSSNSSSF